MKEFLTTAEMARELPISPRTLQNLKGQGIFSKNVHYFKPKGLGLRWKYAAVMKYMDSPSEQVPLKKRRWLS